MTNPDAFYEWLIQSRGYSVRAAKDVVSRCKRIERVLGIDLDGHLTLSDVRERLTAAAPSYLRAGANPVTAVSILRTAAKLYWEYRATHEPSTHGKSLK
jgi:hypothetical protein